jgi:hypothetical protein
MFEHRTEKLLPRAAFIRRMLKYALVSFGFVVISLVIGMAGYHQFEGMGWIDAFVNAAMLMGGMGPVSELHTDAGKLFAGVYALYCGLVVVIAIGLLVAPVLHRTLHHFHVESEADEARGSDT